MGASIYSTGHGGPSAEKYASHGPSLMKSFTSLREPFKKKIVKYDMKGARSARTTVTFPNKTQRKFKTTDLMHSEMVAIEKMLEEGHWKIFLGIITWKDGSTITAEQFSTSEPHCGFCTLFLAALKLPITTPTYGNYQYASQLRYQLPVDLEINPWFMARILDSGCYCGFHMIKRVLNIYVNVPAKDWVLNIKNLAWVDDNSYTTYNPVKFQIFWDDLVNQHNRLVLWEVWKFIFAKLLENNKSSQ